MYDQKLVANTSLFKDTGRRRLHFSNQKYKIKKIVGCFSEEQHAKIPSCHLIWHLLINLTVLSEELQFYSKEIRSLVKTPRWDTQKSKIYYN